jgi:rhodanese-related sulfurtransferase
MKKILIILTFLTLIITLSSCWKIEDNNLNTTETKEFTTNIFTQIVVDDFKKELENSEIILIDVRTPWELITYWKIRENQLLIDINERGFSEKINNLDKHKKYLIYCWHWNRSRVARKIMQKRWFIYVKDLKGWIDAWTRVWKNIIK